jgi:hypothetical protein
MSLAYRLLYAISYTPWEQIAGLPAAKERIAAWFEREEQGREPPMGRRSTSAAASSSTTS